MHISLGGYQSITFVTVPGQFLVPCALPPEHEHHRLHLLKHGLDGWMWRGEADGELHVILLLQQSLKTILSDLLPGIIIVSLASS